MPSLDCLRIRSKSFDSDTISAILESKCCHGEFDFSKNTAFSCNYGLVRIWHSLMCPPKHLSRISYGGFQSG